jgi:hypothetical protein
MDDPVAEMQKLRDLMAKGRQLEKELREFAFDREIALLPQKKGRWGLMDGLIDQLEKIIEQLFLISKKLHERTAGVEEQVEEPE